MRMRPTGLCTLYLLYFDVRTQDQQRRLPKDNKGETAQRVLYSNDTPDASLIS